MHKSRWVVGSVGAAAARVEMADGRAGVDELIINELEAKTRTLDEYKAKIEELRAENNDLLTKLQTKEEDAMKVIKYLREKNDELNDKLQIYSEESATCLLYTSPSPRDATLSRMPSSA